MYDIIDYIYNIITSDVNKMLLCKHEKHLKEYAYYKI